MFEKATRRKLRFNLRGNCSVEDLWDVKLETLDTLYMTLESELKSKKGASSLLSTKNTESEELALKINIIKHIVSVRLKEIDEAKNLVEKKQKKQRILKILDEKQNESLKSMSEDELKKLIEEM